MDKASIREARISALVCDMYDAAIDSSRWRDFAGQLASTFDSNSAVLKIQNSPREMQRVAITDNLVEAEGDREFSGYWHTHDLWFDRAVPLGFGRVITSQDLVDRDETVRNPYYTEWLRPLSIFHMVGTTLDIGDGRIAGFAIHRPLSQGVYTDEECNAFRKLLPHVGRALAISKRLNHAQLAASASFSALDCLDCGVLVVNASRRVRYANYSAESVLARTGTITSRGGKLALANPTTDQQLGENIRISATRLHSDRLSHGVPIVVNRTAEHPLVLTVIPFDGQWSAGDMFASEPLALVFIRSARPIEPSSQVLRDLFGFTTTEANIAVALVSGSSLTDIAFERSCSIETIRSHVKRVFAKTGASRQAEAVSLILGKVAATAPIVLDGSRRAPPNG